MSAQDGRPAIELPPAAELVDMLDDGATYDDLAAVFACSARAASNAPPTPT